MGALYEDVENFFGDIFAWYGRYVARFPWFFVICPLLTCSLLGLGLLSLKYESRLGVLYTPVGSQAARDRAILEDLFPDASADNYYDHQEVTQASFAEVIITLGGAGGGGGGGGENQSGECDGVNDVLSPMARREIQRLRRVIANVTCWHNGARYAYPDVCAVRDRKCVIEGTEVLGRDLEADEDSVKYSVGLPAAPNDSRRRRRRSLGLAVVASSSPSGTTCPEAIKLSYKLRHNTSEERVISVTWEAAFRDSVSGFSSPDIDVALRTSTSLDVELRDHVVEDTRFLIFSILALLVFATIIGSGANCVTNYVTLAYTGVFAALLAILAAFGLFSLTGLRFVDLCGVMPFLVLGIGADDMFQLLTEWRQTNVRESIEERMANTMRSTAVSITITSLTDLIAFCIGATSPYVSVRNFCACSGVAILLCYVNQLTFYSGCIVLHARRVEASRHWVTCLKTKSREELEEEGSNPVTVALCGGNPPRRVGEEGGVCRKVSRFLYTYYPRFLLHWVSKMAVFGLFVAYIAVSFWGATNIQKGTKLEAVVPDDSYLVKYFQLDMEYFTARGPYIMFVAQSTQSLKYHDKKVQAHLAAILRAAEAVPAVVNESHVSWLEHYLAYRRHHNYTSSPPSEQDFIRHGLIDGFLIEHPEYKGDINFNADYTSIIASRFYVMTYKLSQAEAEGRLMVEARRLANSSPLSVIAYSPTFIYFEHFVLILKNTMLPVGVTMIGLLFVALVFIPHPIAVTCNTLAMVSIGLGMVGFMHFWGLALSSITVIQVILSLGICVSFTVHMSHSFMTATGKNRNERVTVAIEKVGIPILNGALSTLFCAVMLSFGSSFIFTSFFKTMVLVFFLGILHSLVFLPVMFSLIGPRRTSKPRVYVAVSPSSRSLQDTYRANSLVPGFAGSDSRLANHPHPQSQQQQQQQQQAKPIPRTDSDLGRIGEEDEDEAWRYRESEARLEAVSGPEVACNGGRPPYPEVVIGFRNDDVMRALDVSDVVTGRRSPSEPRASPTPTPPREAVTPPPAPPSPSPSPSPLPPQEPQAPPTPPLQTHGSHMPSQAPETVEPQSQTQPSQQSHIAPQAQPHIAPQAQPHIAPQTQPPQQPHIAPQTQPPQQPHIAPQAQPHIVPQTQPPQQSHIAPQTQPPEQQYIAPQTQPPQQPHIAPPTQPPQQPHIAPQTQPPQQQYIAPQTQPPQQPHIAPQTQPPQQPHIAPQTQPPQQPRIAPQTQPAAAAAAAAPAAPAGSPGAAPPVISHSPDISGGNSRNTSPGRRVSFATGDTPVALSNSLVPQEPLDEGHPQSHPQSHPQGHRLGHPHVNFATRAAHLQPPSPTPGGKLAPKASFDEDSDLGPIGVLAGSPLGHVAESPCENPS